MDKISKELPELVEDISLLTDNVVEEKTTEAEEVSDVKPADDSEEELDKYLRRFDELDEISAKLGKLIDVLGNAEHDQARVKVLTNIVKAQHVLNNDLLIQLREMNNIFA